MGGKLFSFFEGSKSLCPKFWIWNRGGLQSGGYLKRHMRAVHEGMVPQCTICTIIYLYKKYKSSEVTINFIF